MTIRTRKHLLSLTVHLDRIALLRMIIQSRKVQGYVEGLAAQNSACSPEFNSKEGAKLEKLVVEEADMAERIRALQEQEHRG